jgi:HTH-type transcriptional regulator / antitoxin HigA
MKEIQTKEQYKSALKRIDTLIDSKPNTDEFEELEVLSILVDDYENKHYAIEPLDPIEAIKLKEKKHLHEFKNPF